jgi:hypothetical protein
MVVTRSWLTLPRSNPSSQSLWSPLQGWAIDTPGVFYTHPFAFSLFPLPSSLNFSSRIRYLFFRNWEGLPSSDTGTILFFFRCLQLYRLACQRQRHPFKIAGVTCARISPCWCQALGGLFLRYVYRFIFIHHRRHYTRRFYNLLDLIIVMTFCQLFLPVCGRLRPRV